MKANSMADGVCGGCDDDVCDGDDDGSECPLCPSMQASESRAYRAVKCNLLD